MRVVELLFRKYLDTPYEEYVRKFLSAKSVLDITESPTKNSKRYKRVMSWRDKIHKDCPVSVFRVAHFLRGKETVLSVKTSTGEKRFKKTTADAYRLREYLGDFIGRLDKQIVKSMERYNLDRARPMEDEFEDDGASEFI